MTKKWFVYCLNRPVAVHNAPENHLPRLFLQFSASARSPLRPGHLTINLSDSCLPRLSWKAGTHQVPKVWRHIHHNYAAYVSHSSLVERAECASRPRWSSDTLAFGATTICSEVLLRGQSFVECFLMRSRSHCLIVKWESNSEPHLNRQPLYLDKAA